MSHQALYRKWRSQRFDELVGQDHIVRTLRNALRDDRIRHAYLFTGPRGTGKTSSARILAKAVNCTAPVEVRPCNVCPTCQSITAGTCMDLIEIDAASNTQVEKVRETIVEKVNFAPSEGRYKVYIIDEVHMLSNSAFNALLKTLEEPPPHALFILATTEVHKVPATILSRCQRLDFRRISVEQIADHLNYILEQEGITADRGALELVARQATGSMRDAESILDQLLAYGGDHLSLARARVALGLASSEAVPTLVDCLIAQDVPSGLLVFGRLLDQGVDPRQLTNQFLDYLRALLLALVGGNRELLDLPAEATERLRGQGRHVKPQPLIEIIRLFNQAGAELKQGLQGQLPLELAFIEGVLKLQTAGLAPGPTPTIVLDDVAGGMPDVTPTRRSSKAMPPAASPVMAEALPEVAAERAEVPGQPAPLPVESPPAALPPVESPPAARESIAPARTTRPPAARESTAPARTQAPPPPPPIWFDDEPPSAPVIREAPPAAYAPTPTIQAVPERAAPPPLERESGTKASLGWWQDEWRNFWEWLSARDAEGKRVAIGLKFAEPRRVEQGTLVLGFYYSIHRDKIDKADTRRIVERAIQDRYGLALTLRCEMAPKEANTPSGKTKFEEAAEDPLVRAALKVGGRIVDVRIPE